MKKAKSKRSRKERDRLVLANTGLVYHVARKLAQLPMVKAYGEEDAIQLGFLGLIRAAELWDKSKGIRFGTYAYNAIHNRIIQYVRNWWRKNNLNLSKEISREVKEYRWKTDSEGNLEPSSLDPDLDAVFDSQEYLSKVPKKKRDLIKERYLKGFSFVEMGKRRGISTQAARHQTYRALEKIRKEFPNE